MTQSLKKDQGISVLHYHKTKIRFEMLLKIGFLGGNSMLNVIYS